MKTLSTEPVSIKATWIKLCLVLLLQGQVGIKAGGSHNYKLPHYAEGRFGCTNDRPVPMRLECTALHPQAAAAAQVQAAAASPQAQAAAQAEDPSPTSVAADLGEEGEMGIIPTTLGDLSLEAAAEMDVDWRTSLRSWSGVTMQGIPLMTKG
jgi:hypothetical protein